MAMMVFMLSEYKRVIFQFNHKRKPKLLAELAELTGLHIRNLSRTLKMMEECGVVAIEKYARAIRPWTSVTKLLVVLDSLQGG